MSAKSIYKSPEGEKVVLAWYDEMLTQWPVPHETFNIPTRHGNTFVIRSGKEFAPPLVLLHGAGSNSIIWKSDILDYSKNNQVYAVDLPGEPGKSTQARLDWSGPAFSEWLLDVFNIIQIKKASLIGLSQGAWTALKFSLSYPERIEKLVLMSPGGIIPDKLSFTLRAIPLSMMGDRGIRKINRMLTGDQIITKEVDDGLTLIMTHFNTRIEPLPIFTDQQLHSICMPVLLLTGSKDALRDSEKITARLQNQLPCVKAVIILGGGHALMGTTDYILPFLSNET